MKQRILIYDLETNSQNAEVAFPRIMGLESSESEGFQYTTSIKEMVELIDSHDVIVGYNIIDYDNVILRRFGARFSGKIIIDLYQIIHGKGFGADKGRKMIMQAPDGTHLGTILHSKSMDATSKALCGPDKEGDIDYKWFKQEWHTLSDEIKVRAVQYLETDIAMTSHIYRYCEDFFQDFRDGGVVLDGKFKPYMTEEQKAKKVYLTSSTASYAYKLLCNLAGVDERYQNLPPEYYEGGFVATPSMESAKGNIYCLDYNSLYPHIMIMANLYGPMSALDDCKAWRGEGINETKGLYQADTLSPVGYVLKELYQKRLEYKKLKDERQYTIKIIINTVYGLLGNPAFASVSNFIAAADCTRLGRQWVNAARKKFMEAGYIVLYTDTDSVYLKDPYSDEARLMKVKDAHITDIMSGVPFPQETFDMGIDDRIRYMAFFKGGSGDLLKKNYLYVTTKGDLKIKGMQIIKSTATPLGRQIFADKIKPVIIAESRHKFQHSQIEQWMEEYLAKDISLASTFFKIKAQGEYGSKTSIHYQIASHQLYGEGSWHMLKLKQAHTKGAGAGSNYVSTEYVNEVALYQIDLSKTWSELEPFIEATQYTLDKFW